MLTLPVVRPARFTINQECPQFVAGDGSCRVMTIGIGRRVIATGPLCRTRCPLTAAGEGKVAQVLRQAYEPHFIARTWAKEPADVVFAVPDCWPSIRDALAPLAARPEVRGIYLTGSAIIQGKADPKDVDVLVMVDDPAGFLYEAGRRDFLPAKIDGRKMDYFAWSKFHPFFPALDCETKTLYAPSHRAKPFTVAPGITIERPPADPEIAGTLAEIAAEALAAPPDTLTVAACSAGPQTVARTGWQALHALADVPDVTIAQVRAALDSLTAGHARRQSQLAAYEAEHPIDLANLEQWTHDLHSFASRQAGRPVMTLDVARVVRQIGGPIDLVYLYVDGADEKWRTKVRGTIGSDIPAARCTDAGELRAALKLADRFAPWIRNIYIVTDDQRPAWIAEHARARVVDHRQIIPPKYLPTFNSHAIEPWLYRIPGLSEHFIYGNDDMMFGAPVTPGQFFTREGKMIVRLSDSARAGSGPWNRACANAADLLDTMFAPAAWRKGWHHLVPVRRSMLKKIADDAGEAIRRTAKHRTRSRKDIAWDAAFWQSYALASGYGVMPSLADDLTSEYIGVGTEREQRAFDRQLQQRRHLICVNNAGDADADRVQEWLTKLSDQELTRAQSE